MTDNYEDHYIQFTTRILDEDECYAICRWIFDLPELACREDFEAKLADIKVSRQAIVTFDNSMTKELIYAKLTWG